MTLVTGSEAGPEPPVSRPDHRHAGRVVGPDPGYALNTKSEIPVDWSCMIPIILLMKHVLSRMSIPNFTPFTSEPSKT